MILFRILFMLPILSIGTVCTSQRLITGWVLDEATNKPIAQAFVTIVGKDINTFTNIKGFFQLTIDNTDSITVSFIGYKPLTFISPGATTFQIQLKKVPIVIYNEGM